MTNLMMQITTVDDETIVIHFPTLGAARQAFEALRQSPSVMYARYYAVGVEGDIAEYWKES